MKNLLFVIVTLIIATSVSARNPKVRVGLFKKWYAGAYEEVTGQYSIAIDTATYDFESYEEEEAAFWAEQYDHYYSAYDSLRIIINKDYIVYDNEVFGYVFTVKAKPKAHYYYMIGQTDKKRTISVIMTLAGKSEWQIYIIDSGKYGWGGIWQRRELSTTINRI